MSIKLINYVFFFYKSFPCLRLSRLLAQGDMKWMEKPVITKELSRICCWS